MYVCIFVYDVDICVRDRKACTKRNETSGFKAPQKLIRSEKHKQAAS